MTASFRDWTEDEILENGVCENQCSKCHSFFKGQKNRLVCKDCTMKFLSNKLDLLLVENTRMIGVLAQAKIFVDDVYPQVGIGNLKIKDHGNLNVLFLSLKEIFPDEST